LSKHPIVVILPVAICSEDALTQESGARHWLGRFYAGFKPHAFRSAKGRSRLDERA